MEAFQKHLQDIEDAVMEWLEWEYSDDEDAEEVRLLNASIGNKPAQPDFPEPLGIVRQMKNLGIPLWRGGLYDQPKVHLMECDAVANATARFEVKRAKEAKKKAEEAAKLAKVNQHIEAMNRGRQH